MKLRRITLSNNPYQSFKFYGVAENLKVFLSQYFWYGYGGHFIYH